MKKQKATKRISEKHVKKTMRRLFACAGNGKYTSDFRHEAYCMATALQWSLGGCSWNPLTFLGIES